MRSRRQNNFNESFVFMRPGSTKDEIGLYEEEKNRCTVCYCLSSHATAGSVSDDAVEERPPDVHQ